MRNGFIECVECFLLAHHRIVTVVRETPDEPWKGAVLRKRRNEDWNVCAARSYLKAFGILVAPIHVEWLGWKWSVDPLTGGDVCSRLALVRERDGWTLRKANHLRYYPVNIEQPVLTNLSHTACTVVLHLGSTVRIVERIDPSGVVRVNDMVVRRS